MNNYFLIKKIVQTGSEYPNIIFNKEKKIYTCINPYYYHVVREFNEYYKMFDGIFVDGITMCWWIRIIWHVKVPRLSFDMTGIARDLFNYLDNSGTKSVYLIGSKQEEIEKTVNIIRARYQNIHNILYRNGYFKSIEDRSNTINQIIKSRTDYVIIGMGAPLQEKFALDLKEAGYEGIVFTCGGFFHQTTKSLNYYPLWVDKLNLRAFYRLFHEKGMLWRLYHVLIEFPIIFFYDSIISKCSRIYCKIFK